MAMPTFLDRDGRPVERASRAYKEMRDALEAYLREISLTNLQRLRRPISGLIRDLADF